MAPNVKKIFMGDTEVVEVDVGEIEKVDEVYPPEFLDFCKENKLVPPNINSCNGKALNAMLNNPYKFWTRKSCDEFCKKFDIKTKDSIQLFNKHSQWGLKTSKTRGKNFIILPYEVSNKVTMRKNFKYDGTDECKFKEIDCIKNNIKEDYLEVPNDLWQLGHKNPDSLDNSCENMVLQPPIQAKYRDNYIFIDTLTKIPTPKKFILLDKAGESPYTLDQQKELLDYLTLKFKNMNQNKIENPEGTA